MTGVAGVRAGALPEAETPGVRYLAAQKKPFTAETQRRRGKRREDRADSARKVSDPSGMRLACGDARAGSGLRPDAQGGALCH